MSTHHKIAIDRNFNDIESILWNAESGLTLCRRSLDHQQRHSHNNGHIQFEFNVLDISSFTLKKYCKTCASGSSKLTIYGFLITGAQKLLWTMLRMYLSSLIALFFTVTELAAQSADIYSLNEAESHLTAAASILDMLREALLQIE